MQEQTFLADFMVTVIDDMETGRRLKFRQSRKVAEGYIVNFRSTLGWVRRFDEEKKRKQTLDDVDMVFQREFVGFMIKNGLKPNTIKTRLSVIHTVMREALIRGLSKNDAYQDPDFIPLLEATDSVYLTNKQIEALGKLDVRSCEGMSGKMMTSLEQVRDLFLMGCMSGQRFSDYSRIEQSMVVSLSGIKFISLRQIKTDIPVLIPMSKRMEELLAKYSGSMPKIDNQTFNHKLKMLGEMMGWTWKPDATNGNERFCDMLTSHTARRSFATNAYQRGIPLKSIMAVTGHTSERTLRIYLRLDAKEKAMMAVRDFGSFLKIGARI